VADDLHAALLARLSALGALVAQVEHAFGRLPRALTRAEVEALIRGVDGACDVLQAAQKLLAAERWPEGGGQAAL
jgi:hypothetical protein